MGLNNAELRFEHIKRVLLSIRNVNQLIVSENDPLSLVQNACRILAETLGYLNVTITLFDETVSKVIFTASSDVNENFSKFSERVNSGHFPHCMQHTLDKDAVVVIKNPAIECLDCPLSINYTGRSGLTRRLCHAGQAYGILSVSVPAEFANDPEEQELFEELAKDLALGLHKIKTEKSLIESQKDLKLAQSIARIGSWRLNLKSMMITASEEAYRIYGLSGREIPLEVIQNACLPEFRPALDAEMKNLIENGQPYNIEFQILRQSDQSIRYIHSIAEYNSEQKIIVGTIQDITERKLAEDAAHTRELYLQKILQTTIDGFWVLDSTGTLIEVNQSYCDMSGYSKEELLGQKIADLEGKEEPAETSARINRIITNGSEIFETLHRRKDGSLWPVEISTTWMPENGGRFICFCRDLSERKLRDDRIALLGHMLDSAPAAISIHDTHGKFVFANRLCASMHGYACEEEFLKINLRELDVPESLAILEDRIKIIAENGEARFEVAHYRKDGSSFPLEILAKAIEWDGKPAILSIATDITERKRAEEELMRSRNQLQKIFEILPIGLWFADKNGNLLRGNAMGVKIWGGEPHVPIEKYGVFQAWRLPSREKLGAEDWALAKTIRHGVTIVDELLEIESFDGKRKTILNYTAPVLDDKGELSGAIVVNLDISDRQALEKQLRQSQKMESIGRLAGGVAHDFNNMLGVIIGNAELAMATIHPQESAQEFLRQIISAAERSAGITRQLLAFARKQDIAPTVLDLNETISGTLKMIQRLIGEDITLKWVPAPLPLTIEIDPSQIDQILANLCVNARDAIAGVGNLVVEASLVVFDQAYCKRNDGYTAGEFVKLSVSDDGCGMSPEILENVFEPFFSTKDLGKGTGLGLATVYGIVKQNQGFIKVYSEPGEGTTFNIFLPAYKEKSLPSIKAPVQVSGSVQGNETILLVEDEPSILKLAHTALEELGYVVLSAGSPVEAIRIAREHPGSIDLLMTDVVMPEMNGRCLAEKIMPFYPEIRLLFMSGYTADVIACRGVLDQGVNFIQKPFSINDMARKVRQVLDS